MRHATRTLSLLAPIGAVVLTLASSSGAVTGSSIADLAKANLGKLACSTNSKGGHAFESSCTGYPGGLPEYWCADFAHWVWAEAGVNTAGVDPAAASFLYDYAGGHQVKSTPEVGDAAVFASCAWGHGSCTGWDAIEHVAIVISVTTQGGKNYIETVSGDWGGYGSTEPVWASHSKVVLNGPAYLGEIGAYSSTMGMWIAGFVAPVGLTETPPPPPPTPHGYLDGATCTTVDGWTQYAPTATTAIKATVSFNGAAGASGATAFTLTANQTGPAACNASGYCVDHGFSMVTPRGIMDGAAHKVYAYGVNPVAGQPSASLTDSPRTLTCSAPAIPAGDVKRHVTSPTILGDWKFDTFTDEAPYTTAELAAVPTGVDLGSAPSLVRVTGQPAIYVVDGAFKRHVVNGASFGAWRMTAAEVKAISQTTLDSYEAGPDWPAAPLLAKDPTAPAVYLLDVPLPTTTDAGAHADASTHADSGSATDGGPILAPDGALLLDAGTGPVPLGDGGPPLLLDGGSDASGAMTLFPDAAVTSKPGAAPPHATDGGASASPDASGGAGPVASSGGCSVAHGAGAESAWLVVLGGMLALTRRSRRRAA